jgi:hypothetical protein
VPVLALAVAALAGCGGGTDPGTAASVVSPSSSAAAPAGPTVAGVAPTGLPEAVDLDTRCADALDDGDGHDLAGVELVRADDELVAAFTLTAAPVSGASFMTVELRDAGGAAVRQLGIELDGAEPVAAYIATSPGEPVQRLEGAVHVIGAEVHAAFPATVLDGLGSPWGWLAGVGTESAIEDVCAASGATGSGGAPSPVVVP